MSRPEPDPPAWLTWLVGVICAAVMGLCAQNGPVPPPAPPSYERSVLVEAAEPAPIFPASPAAKEPAIPRWHTWEEAVEVQTRTGRPILVLIEYSDPAKKAACAPCLKLAGYLDDPDSFAAFAELGIPAKGETDDWQTGPAQSAPQLVYVTDATDPTPPRQTFGRSPKYPRGFVLDDADAFLQSVEAWIHDARD